MIVTDAWQLILCTDSQSFLQIRAEKPYYMADPEVDSLVSLSSSSSSWFFQDENLLLLSLYRTLLTEKREKTLVHPLATLCLYNCRLNEQNILIATTSWKFRKLLNFFPIINGLLGEKRENSVLFKFKLPVTPQILGGKKELEEVFVRRQTM